MLLHLMDRLGATRGDTLMIGDTTHDLELAPRAGASAVAVAYGAHAAEGSRRRAARDRAFDRGAARWLRANAE